MVFQILLLKYIHILKCTSIIILQYCRENVCIEKTEKEEKKNGTARVGQQHIWIDIGIGTFEHCKQTAAKYICTTV